MPTDKTSRYIMERNLAELEGEATKNGFRRAGSTPYSTHIKPSAFVNGTLTTVQFTFGCTGSSWSCSGSLLWKPDDPVHMKCRHCDHSHPSACAVVSHCCLICVSLLTFDVEHLSICLWAIHKSLVKCQNLLPIFFLQLSVFSLSFKSLFVCSRYKVFIVYKVK